MKEILTAFDKKEMGLSVDRALKNITAKEGKSKFESFLEDVEAQEFSIDPNKKTNVTSYRQLKTIH